MALYYRITKWWKNLKVGKRRQIFFGVGAALVLLIALVLVIVFLGKKDPLFSPEMDAIKDRAVLRVGVRTDIPGFSQQADGEYTGLEADIAREIARSIFDDETKVQFVPVDYTTRSIKLLDDTVDCVIALSPGGWSFRYIYSDSYYTDAVGIVVRADGIASLNELSGKKVGVLTRPGSPSHHGARTVFEAYVKSARFSCEIISFSSTPDMVAALKSEAIDALALESALIGVYYDGSMRVLSDAVGLVPYCVSINGNSSLQEIVNNTISRMKADGTLQALIEKHGLTVY